jgi:hypothetical protein
MNSRQPRFGGDALGRRAGGCLWMLALCLGSIGTSLAAPADPGRLFFTPAQRAQLEDARARNVTPPGPGQQAADRAPAPLRYDGLVIRSDGKTTRWIDGKAQRDGSAVSGLKPGQIRANGKVYEPYQVVRPTLPVAADPDSKESAP